MWLAAMVVRLGSIWFGYYTIICLNMPYLSIILNDDTLPSLPWLRQLGSRCFLYWPTDVTTSWDDALDPVVGKQTNFRQV